MIAAARSLGLLLTLTTVAAQPAVAGTPLTGPPHGPASFLDALARVPDTAEARGGAVEFIDFRVMEVARPGAARPASLAELVRRRDADDPAAVIWLAAASGLTDVTMGSRSGDLLSGLFDVGQGWPTAVGFDFFQIDRQVAFDAPPFGGLALIGRFDPAAVTDAFVGRGYTATGAGERTLLCGPSGCGSGLVVDFGRIDPGIPFGGDSGRAEPIAISDSDLLVAADDATIQAMLAAASGTAGSLAANPDHRAAVEAIDSDARLIQAVLLPVGRLAADVADRQAEMSAEEAAAFEPMPPYRLAAIADSATETEQVASIVLVYDREDGAADGAAVLLRRLATLRSTLIDRRFSDLMADRGVTSITGRVVPFDASDRFAAVITLRAPLAGNEPDPATGEPRPSSSVYQLLARSIAYRDALWLAPDLPHD